MAYEQRIEGKTFQQYVDEGLLGTLDPKDIAALVAEARIASQPKPAGDVLVTLPGGQVLTAKVGDKGGISVYGLGRFPVTLYYEQWIKLFMATEGIVKFGDACLASGKIKPDSDDARKARRDAEKAKEAAAKASS